MVGNSDRTMILVADATGSISFVVITYNAATFRMRSLLLVTNRCHAELSSFGTELLSFYHSLY